MPDDLHVGFSAQPTTPALARGAIVTYLSTRGLDELIPTAALLVSELVTNAVLHAGGPITLRANITDAVLCILVDDPSDTTPEIRTLPAATKETGRGLHILEALATQWGVTAPNGNGSGKTTWFELRR